MKYQEHIKEVYKNIAPYIKKTPVLYSSYFSQKNETDSFFKCENLQYTHAFKVRGAFNKIIRIPDKNKIMITASAGNHGLAIAFASKKFDMKAIVVVPKFVPEFRINSIKALGAEVIVHGTTMDELNAKVAEYTQDPKYIYVHGFDDDDIIAGQATVAHELLQEVPDINTIVVPIGGGGLISGIAHYAKSFNAQIEIYGVETIGADAMSRSLEAGKIVALQNITSIAISLGASKVAERTFAIVKKYVKKVVTVSDNEAIQGLKEILEKEKLLVEPASACAIAAVMYKKIPDIKNKKVAVILSGANLSLNELKAYL